MSAERQDIDMKYGGTSLKQGEWGKRFYADPLGHVEIKEAPLQSKKDRAGMRILAGCDAQKSLQSNHLGGIIPPKVQLGAPLIGRNFFLGTYPSSKTPFIVNVIPSLALNTLLLLKITL